MWDKLTLRAKIGVIIVVLVAVSLIGGGAMVWYTYRVETMLDTIVNTNISAYQSAESIEIALVNQKGFVSYYLIDKDPDWLRQLGEWRQIFRDRLKEAKARSKSPQGLEILTRVESQYKQYVVSKDKVLEMFNRGDTEEALKLHSQTRTMFFSILTLCDEFKKIQEKGITDIVETSQRDTKSLRGASAMALCFQLFVGVFLSVFLIGRILRPLMELAEKTERANGPHKRTNLVETLAHNVDDLLRDAGEAHHELERSRETLVMAEKMAMVGKLAAGMAHSVRNPLTSVKMRLFSLNRSLSMNSDQAEDFAVISEEIGHIDTIVQNFLEFARPPKLKMQKMSPSIVVNMMIQLLTHRLKSYDVTVNVVRDAMLPDITCDPEQLKEVFVNLVENACQAMGRGGLIIVTEQVRKNDSGKDTCLICVKDTGPGLPANILEKIFNPFFTTKEEGTGLGLSIAERIIQNHGGKISVKSAVGEGTSFYIELPVAEQNK
jgi:signal transduction histidine kinase